MEGINDKLELYAVRNSEGKWFRSKGYGGCGDNWVTSIKDAKIYAKIGPARSVATFYGKFDLDKIPQIVKIVSTEFVVMDETDRVKKSVSDKKRREAEEEIARHNRAVAEAERNLQQARNKLNQLKK